jgi:hypothetical protein
VFNGTPQYLVGDANSDFFITLALDWDVDYGTYFVPDVGSDSTGDYISQQYGF